MKGAAFAFFLSLIATPLAAQGQAPFAMDGPPIQEAMVNGLREISGLAMASGDAVYAHNDEFGIVYEVSLADGSVKSAFALGDPTVSADFEGIAAEGGRIYLATSMGLIYEAPIGAHRRRVLYNIFDTGVGKFCEVEGLSNGLEPGEFLILCKKSHVREFNDRLVVFRWSVRTRRPVSKPWINIPYVDFLSQGSRKIFRPSAIEWDAENNSMIVLSARSRQLVALQEDGRVLYQADLPAELHAQAEGVVLTPEGDLIIADEGAGRGPGKISIYKFRH